MAALVAATSSVELPGNVDAHAAIVLILTVMGADVNATVGNTLQGEGLEDVIGQDSHIEALVLEEALA